MRSDDFFCKVKLIAIRCKNIMHVLKTLLEKGTGPWPPSREPLLKKLKISPKPPVSRPSIGSGRASSTAESPPSVESSSDSEADDRDSDYETGSEQEIEPEEPSPLPASRPEDPIKAVEYDTIKAVWAKRRVILSGAVIRSALSEYWNIVKGIRDKWKTEVSLFQQASEKQEKGKIVEYERRAANQRKLLESCIRLTLKHGHPDIIEKYVLSFSVSYTTHYSSSHHLLVATI